MRQLLKDFQQAIKDEALWIYGESYSKLPKSTQMIIRMQVMKTFKDRISNIAGNENDGLATTTRT